MLIAMDTVPQLLIDHLLSIVVLLIILFIAIFWKNIESSKDKLSHIPLIGSELGNTEQRRKAFTLNARPLYAKGYKLFKDAPFRITDENEEKVILPRRHLDEIRWLSDDYLDSHKSIYKHTMTRYTKLEPIHAHMNLLTHVTRSDLTHSLARINTQLAAEVERTVVEVLPRCDDWTSVHVASTSLRITAIASGSIFVGSDLCRREEYVNSSINFTVDIFTAIPKLKMWSPWLRPIGQYFIPELKRVAEHRRKVKELLDPVITERSNMAKKGQSLPDDMLQWMLNKREDFNLAEDDISTVQLNLGLASIHTTALTIVSILYDLVTRPELIEDIREEIKSAVANNDGIITMRALFEMKLLDSVMKETVRLTPGSLVRFNRYVKKSVTLKDGTYLPSGTWIEANHGFIVSDPTLYSNPENFDGYRFLNLRNKTAVDPLGYKNTEQYQFVTSTKDFMHFGYGPHACPGRFFAANVIKLITARILMEFDIKMPDGMTEPYQNTGTGFDVRPDVTKMLMFKRVKV